MSPSRPARLSGLNSVSLGSTKYVREVLKRYMVFALQSAFALALAIFGVQAFSAAPQLKSSAPAFHRLMLGDFEVTAVSDGTFEIPVIKLLDTSREQVEAALADAFLVTPVETSVNTFLVNTGQKLILIDAGAGGLLGPALGKLSSNMKAAGYTPDQVDDVYLTHLHPDHVGGLVATATRQFPNAVVHANRRDLDYWTSATNAANAAQDSKPFFEWIAQSLKPYTGAGKVQPFDGDKELSPGIRPLSSFGHSPGHVSFHVESKGQKLILFGDTIHAAFLQFANPSISIAFDSDAAQAADSRRTLLSQLAKERTLIGAAHVQFPGLGYVRRQDKGFVWIPINFMRLK